MIRYGIAVLVLAGCLSVGFAPQEALAQGPPQQDTAQLVFDREVFVYPRYNRRNPFRPLLNSSETGPRYEELILLGIVYSTDPDLSVALFGGGTAAATAPVTSTQSGAQIDSTQTGEGITTTGEGMITYRVRRGEFLGNLRIIEIQTNRVIVDVTEFGVTDQRVFELQRGSGGNGP